MWTRSSPVFEPPALVAGLDDIAVVRQPVEHGGRHFGVAEDLRPVGEGEIRGYDNRGVFIELADQMEQQLSAGLAEGQIAEFVDDDEIMAQQSLDDPTAPSGGLFLFELIDEIDEIEESPSRAGANDRGGDGDARWVFPVPGETATWRRDSGERRDDLLRLSSAGRQDSVVEWSAGGALRRCASYDPSR